MKTAKQLIGEHVSLLRRKAEKLLKQAAEEEERARNLKDPRYVVHLRSADGLTMEIDNSECKPGEFWQREIPNANQRIYRRTGMSAHIGFQDGEDPIINATYEEIVHPQCFMSKRDGAAIANCCGSPCDMYSPENECAGECRNIEQSAAGDLHLCVKHEAEHFQ